MKRRLRVGTISPSKGHYFLSNAAPYPPPSALLSPSEALPHLRKISSMREEALKAGNEAKLFELTALFLQASRSLDGLDFSTLPSGERKDASRFMLLRERLMGSLSLALMAGKAGNPQKARPAPRHVSFEIPDAPALPSPLRKYNLMLAALHSGESPNKEVLAALNFGVSSMNARLSSDIAEVGEIAPSRQYIGFMKLSEHYDRLISSFLLCAKRNDLPGMMDVLDVMGLGISKKMAKAGALPAPQAASCRQ